MKATVTSKGQVTIPKAARDKLGLRAGSVIDFEVSNGRLIGRKSKEQFLAEIMKWAGRGKDAGKLTTDQLLKEMRGGYRD